MKLFIKKTFEAFIDSSLDYPISAVFFFSNHSGDKPSHYFSFMSACLSRFIFTSEFHQVISLGSAVSIAFCKKRQSPFHQFQNHTFLPFPKNVNVLAFSGNQLISLLKLTKHSSLERKKICQYNPPEISKVVYIDTIEYY